LRHVYFLSSAVVSERFFNFLPNFARQFPEKDGEEARDRCRIHGIGFEFFDIPMDFPAYFGTAPEGTGRFILDADEKLTAFMELQSAIQGTSEHVDGG
jgi:hypothetical protein